MNYIYSHWDWLGTDENKTLRTKSEEMCFFTWEFNIFTCCLLLNTCEQKCKHANQNIVTSDVGIFTTFICTGA